MATSARRSFRSLFLVTFIILLCGFLGVVFGQKISSESSAPGIAGLNDNLRNFAQVYEVVEQNYAEPVDPDKAIYNGAIPGMLRVLDPHSNFFDPKANALMKEDQRGKYYGVGMQVGPRDNKVIVIAPFAGAPAYRAGIRPGDVIIGVDGKPTDNMSVGDVADLLKGPKNTVVKITVLREGTEKPLDFSVTRDEISRYSVDVHFLIRPGIGYMHISNFSNENTEQEVTQALNEFGDLKGLVLDLRGNPGGLLGEGVGVADKFLKKGASIVSFHGRSAPEKVYRATHGNNNQEYPLVVLVNRGTASAAEIVSGAIQDHDRGLVAGEITFGKGLVQTVYPLSENTALALTTAKYYTPSGRLIQRNYNGVSLYDYYYSRESDENNANKEVRLTDSGRTVYGGGGITPDVKFDQPKNTHLQDELLLHTAFFDFAKHYLINRQVTKNFEVDDAVLQDFRRFLDEKKIPFTEADLMPVNDWVKANIKSEIFTSQFGEQDGRKVQAELDPEVQKAIGLMPQARALEENARKIIAERNNARLSNQ